MKLLKSRFAVLILTAISAGRWYNSISFHIVPYRQRTDKGTKPKLGEEKERKREIEREREEERKKGRGVRQRGRRRASSGPSWTAGGVYGPCGSAA